MESCSLLHDRRQSMGNNDHRRPLESLFDRRCDLGVHPNTLSASHLGITFCTHSKSTDDVAGGPRNQYGQGERVKSPPSSMTKILDFLSNALAKQRSCL